MEKFPQPQEASRPEENRPKSKPLSKAKKWIAAGVIAGLSLGGAALHEQSKKSEAPDPEKTTLSEKAPAPRADDQASRDFLKMKVPPREAAPVATPGVETAGHETKQESVSGKEKKLEGTESSRWASAIIEGMKNDLSRVKTKEDAEWLVRTYYDQVVKEFYFPTKGNITKTEVYGVEVATRKYAKDDGVIILNNLKEMRKMMGDLNSQYGVEAYDKRLDQLSDIEQKVEIQSSYAHEKQGEVLDKALEDLK